VAGSLPARWRAQPVALQETLPADPVLQQLLLSAARDNLTIAIARERLTAARLLAQGSAVGFRPMLTARGSPVSNPSDSAGYFQAGFDATWELGLFGRSDNSRQLAHAEVGAVAADLRAANVVVRAEVTRTYIEMRCQEAQRLSLDESIQVTGRLEQLLTRRQALGLGTLADIHQIVEARLSLQSARARTEEMTSRLAGSLAVLLGRVEPAPEWLAAGASPEVGVVPVSDLPADLLRNRPDILRSEQEVLRAAAQLGLAQADLYPQLGLLGSLSYSFRMAGSSARSTGSLLSIAPTIDIPLFDWGLRRATRDARGAELKAASLAYRQAVLEAVADTESALASLRAAQLQVQDRQQQVAQRVTGFTRAENLQRNRMGSDIDTLTARLAVLDAERQLSEALAEQGTAFVAVRKALGDALAAAPDGSG
jgi:multidrug efflux system outer membrane protein